jgi:hypothetical protein
VVLPPPLVQNGFAYPLEVVVNDIPLMAETNDNVGYEEKSPYGPHSCVTVYTCTCDSPSDVCHASSTILGESSATANAYWTEGEYGECIHGS